MKHRDILISSIAATLAAAIMMTSRFAMFWGGGRDSDREGSNPVALLATIILAPVAAMLIQAAISRSREYDADAGGAAIAGRPLGLVSALKKIEAASRVIPLDANPATAHMFIIKPFSLSGLTSLFSTHPPTDAASARCSTRVRRSHGTTRTPLAAPSDSREPRPRAPSCLS